MALVVILFHIIGNTLFGLVFFRFLKTSYKLTALLPIAFIIGAFIDTLFGFCLLWMGIYEFVAFYITSVAAIFFWTFVYYKNKGKIKFQFRLIKLQLTLLEWVLVVPIILKIFTSLYTTINFPLYFDDAMTHWSGRAKALYGKVNWSLDSSSPFFLGKEFGYDEYPLFLVIWRSTNAHLNGGWNELISKADSWIFYVCLMAITFSLVNSFSKKKWIALGGTFIVSALPLMWYHSFSGYSEITVTCLVLMTSFALLNKNIVIASILTSCLIWTKNEGLLIFLPVFSVAFCLFTFIDSKYKLVFTIVSSLKYFSFSLLFICPWLLFRQIHNVAWTVPVKPENYYHEGSLKMFYDMIFFNPSNSILWLIILLFIVSGFLKWYKSSISIFLLTFLSISICLFIYVFCFTGNNIFLVNQMTIHRSMLQIAPIAVVLICQIASLEKASSFESNLKLVE